MTQPDLFAPCPYPNPPDQESPTNPAIAQQFPVIPHARKLVAQVIEAEQDFEFYPTTSEIIGALIRDAGLYCAPNEHGNRYRAPGTATTILDIGAGNGKVLLALRAKADDTGHLRSSILEGVVVLVTPEQMSILEAAYPNEQVHCEEIVIFYAPGPPNETP